jgi:hypothetical protein
MNDIDEVDATAPPADAPAPAPAADGEATKSRPILATMAVCGFILVLLYRQTGMVSDDLGEHLVFTLAYIAPAALIAWGIAFAVSIRKASTRWKFGSFGIVAAFAILAAIARAGMAMAADPAAIPDPYDQLMASLTENTGADRRAFDLEMDRAGFTRIATLEGLTLSDPILSRCDRFDALAVQAAAMGRRWPEHLAKAGAAGKSAGMPEEELRIFHQAYGKMDYPGTWRLNGRLVQAIGDMCRFLASHKWQSMDGQVTFLRNEDLGGFTILTDRLQSIEAEQQRHSAEGTAMLRRELASAP